jgi:molecular chaperone Hsp33
LYSLGREELQGLLEERGLIEADCSFCNRHYEFDSIDIEQIFAEGISPDIPKTTH